jgi:hypothetical protein
MAPKLAGRSEGSAKEARDMKDESRTASAFSWMARAENSPAEGTLNHSDQAKKQVVVLDMGEASREEGFRLNGCR